MDLAWQALRSLPGHFRLLGGILSRLSRVRMIIFLVRCRVGRKKKKKKILALFSNRLKSSQNTKMPKCQTGPSCGWKYVPAVAELPACEFSFSAAFDLSRLLPLAIRPENMEGQRRQAPLPSMRYQKCPQGWTTGRSAFACASLVCL